MAFSYYAVNYFRKKLILDVELSSECVSDLGSENPYYWY